MTGKEKNLVSEYADQAFHGQMVRQEIPVCECGREYNERDIYDAPGVFFRDVSVLGKTFTLIEPICPVCKQRIQGNFHILN